MLYDFETLVNRSERNSIKWKMMNERVNVNDEIPPFSVADYDFEYPPELLAGFRNYISKMIFGYSYAGESYYDSFIDWMSNRHNFSVEREWILDGNGVLSSICNSINAFSEEDDGVIIMPPVYPPFAKTVDKNNRKLVECPLVNNAGNYQIDFTLLEKLSREDKNKILVFCSPHNPVGRVWKKSELERLAQICNQNNILVISDEIHQDILVNKAEHTVYSSINEETLNNSIILTSASKSFNLAGARTSMIIIANRKLREKYAKYVEENCHINLNAFGYKLFEIAYKDCENWFDEFLFTVENNYKMMKEALEGLNKDIKVSSLEGTYLMWVDMRSLNLSDNDLYHFLVDECKIFINRGDSYGESGSGFIRWNIAVPDWTLEDAIKRLTEGLNKLNI